MHIEQGLLKKFQVKKSLLTQNWQIWEKLGNITKLLLKNCVLQSGQCQSALSSVIKFNKKPLIIFIISPSINYMKMYQRRQIIVING